MNRKLFKTKNNEWITDTEIIKKLVEIKAYDCDVLFVHSDLSFGVPNLECNRNDILSAVFDCIKGLGVKNICFPTFTFSFCNGKDYNVTKSKSKMGALNEFVRKQEYAVRSIDPLMSVTLVGNNKSLVENIEHNSVGVGSTFDQLHHHKNVKFLFFGVSAAKCFTYTHYIEERIGVPYRYNRQFSGTIINGNQQYQDTYNLFVRYEGVVPTTKNDFEQYLLKNELLKLVKCGDDFISCIDEDTAYPALCEKISNNINYMLDKPFPKVLNEKFDVVDMVSL